MMSRNGTFLFALCVPLAACNTGKLDLGGTETGEALGPNDVVGLVQMSDGSPGTASVLSGGALTQTDAQGQFVLRNAPSRYDVALAAPWSADAGTPPSALVYVGLTTRRPILTLPATGATAVSAKSSLHVTYPPPTVVDTGHLLFFEVPFGTTNFSPGIGGGPTDPFPVPLPAGASSTDRQIASFAYTSSQGSLPTNFLGYATASLHFEAGATTDWTPSYAPVEAMTVTGSPTLGDPSQTLFEAYLCASLSGKGYWAELLPQLYLPPYSFVVPKAQGVSWAIQFNAYGPGGPGSAGGAATWAWARVGADGSVPSVRIPPPPRPVSPPDGTTGFGVGSIVTWTGEGVCTVTLSAGYSNLSAPSISIVTDQQTATIPDTSALGITLPSRVTYRWFVSCAESSEPPYGGDPVLLPNDRLASGGYSDVAMAPTAVTR